MKKIALMLLALAFASGTAFAAGAGGSGVSGDLHLNYASEPTGGFDGTFGLEVGANVDLKRLGTSISTSKGVDLLGRASIAYYNWDGDFFGVDVEYRRIPVFVGGRVQTEVSPQLKLYGQLGLELSFDRAEVFIPGLGKASESDVNLGLTPGVGLIVPLSNQLYVGAKADWHIITDDYFTLGVGIGMNF